MIKHVLIFILAIIVRQFFFYTEFLEPVKVFPFFNNVHCDFDEVLEGFSWKKIIKDQRKEIALKISEIPENTTDPTLLASLEILQQKHKANPKYYANGHNLLPHPIIMELLDMIYVKLGRTGVFYIYLVLDMLTCMLLNDAYQSTLKRRGTGVLSLLLICMNPLSIISTCILNTNTFMYFFFVFILVNMFDKEASEVQIAAFNGLL
jgi:hypothetical protein